MSDRESLQFASFRPLEGVRILAVESAASLPAGTRTLADLGADVVRVAERPGSYNQHIRVFDGTLINKQSIRLDLKDPRGSELARRLAAVADVVCSNFRPDVMPRLGLGYGDLRKLRSDIIVVQLSGYGAPGPWERFPAYGPSVEAAGGMSASMGPAGTEPHRVGGGVFADTLGGRYAALAIVAALVHRDLTGEGQHIDASMYEAIAASVGDLIIEASRDGRAPERTGNRDRLYAPQGIYPCAGDDEWVALSVTSDEEWAALVRLLGDASLEDDSLVTLADRRGAHDAIDEAIGRWTRTREKLEAAEALQAAGVPAGPVQKTSDIPFDEQYRAREFFQVVRHERALMGYGTHLHMTLPGRFVGYERAPLADHASDGATAREVLRRWLDLGGPEIESLAAGGVFGEAIPVLPPEAEPPDWFGARAAIREPEFARRLGLEPARPGEA